VARDDPSPAAQRVACGVCLKEVPKSEAVSPEASDYVIYFCGLDCFATWKNLDRKQDSDDIRRAIDDGMEDLRIKKPR
jgi:hypothetical protein